MPVPDTRNKQATKGGFSPARRAGDVFRSGVIARDTDLDPRRAGIFVWIVIVLTCALGLLLAGSAVAAGYSATSTYDPTPGSPGSGDECTITFSSSGNTAQNQKDVNASKKAFDDAMAGSNDMTDKVKDACAKNGNALNVNVARDDSDTSVGSTNTNGNINLDLGDMDAMSAHLSGKAKDKEKIIKNFLSRVIAHEVDHNREAPGQPHGDPADPQPGETGPAVDDANAVASDLGTGEQRNEYAYKKDGKWKIDFTVDKQKVTLDVSGLLAARNAASKFAPATEHTLTPAGTEDLPGEPCGSSPCYALAVWTDSDLDGIDDLDGLGFALDNCVALANPWQTDVDDDGDGHGCDMDDDADGCPSTLENVVGCSDLCPTCMPEHWSCSLEPAACAWAVNPCLDGLDNDNDGHGDLLDQGCVVPPADTWRFPTELAAWQVYPDYRRFDLGGVPENGDALMVTGSMFLDLDLDTVGDEMVSISGIIAVLRDEPLLHANGTPEWLDIEIVAMSLHGSASFGSVTITERPDLFSPGLLLALSPVLGSSYPASGGLEPFLEMNAGGLPLHAVGPTYLQPGYDILSWPPYESFWSTITPTTMFDPSDTPIMDILFMDLEFVRDTDFDDVFDPADNCPRGYNPGQGDGDSDLVGNVCDCDAADPTVWLTPLEVPGVLMWHDWVGKTTYLNAGQPPAGADLELYDVIRSPTPDGFAGGGAVCLGIDLSAVIDVPDGDYLGPGEAYYYLVRGENGCPGPMGTGSLGEDSDGIPRAAISCP